MFEIERKESCLRLIEALKSETNLIECSECKKLFTERNLIYIGRYKNTQIRDSKVCPECFDKIKSKEFIKLI